MPLLRTARDGYGFRRALLGPLGVALAPPSVLGLGILC
jgi:hypothetical protein